MMAYRDGDAIVVPKRADGPDAVGDGYVRLEPGDPDYQMWDTWLTGLEQPQPDDPVPPNGEQPEQEPSDIE